MTDWRRRKLPARTLEEVHEAFPHIRQSLLASWDNCALSTLMELEGHAYTNAAQARGIIFHRYAAEVLRTLRETGQASMPTEEAMAILYEVSAQRDVPPSEVVVVPARERRLLRMAALFLVTERGAAGGRQPREFNMARLVAVERRLFGKVRCEELTLCRVCGGSGRTADGANECRGCHGAQVVTTGATYERSITGRPDALLMDPDPDPRLSGAVVLDWKTSRRAPAAGKPGDHHDDPDHVSYMGYFQQRHYGLLVLQNYPAVNRVKLREFYPLEDTVRYATVYRSDLEHIEREFAGLMESLDRALMAGSMSPVWQPSPGKHCSYCPAPQRCPLKPDVRVADSGDSGGIATQAEAARAAAQFVVADQARKVLRDALKEWANVHGPVPVKSAKGRYEMRFRNGTFGMFVPDDSDRGPKDRALDDAFAVAAARTGEEATS